jgi:hypothetical protein
MNSARSDRIRRILMCWLTLSTLFAWLPFVRSIFDGPSYSWGGDYWGIQFSGSGLGGDFYILPLAVAYALTMLWLGWRGGRQPFHWLMLGWMIPGLIRSAYESITAPEQFRFRGDSLGIDLSLAWFAPALQLSLVALAIYWVVSDCGRRDRSGLAPLTRANQWMLALAVGLLPIQYLLLKTGGMQSPTDIAGVLLTMAQWVLVNVALAWGAGRAAGNVTIAAARR